MPKVSKNQRVHQKEDHKVYGPCVDCGKTDGTFVPVRRYSPTGRKRMIRLCTECVTYV